MAPAKKLLSARASIRTALQSPTVQAFMPANDPDSAKVGKQKVKKGKPVKGTIGQALMGTF